MLRALLIDDKQDVLDFVGEILEHSLQHEFHSAFNNEDARKLLQANDYDYVLLDLRIPASRRGGNARIQNGVSLFHQILKIKGVGKVPVIIMTSHTAEALLFVNEFQNDGLTFYLAKDLWDTAKTVEAAVTEALAAAEAKRVRPAADASPPSADKPRTRREPDAEPQPTPAAPPKPKNGTPAKSDPAPAPAPADPGRWASVPNDVVEIEEFMARFCEMCSKENRMYRKRALLAAARNETVTLPPLAVPYRNGGPKKFFTHDLLDAWQGFLDERVEIPPLLPQYRADAAG